jgi:Potential Queuosine, Q, salvage protein family
MNPGDLRVRCVVRCPPYLWELVGPRHIAMTPTLADGQRTRGLTTTEVALALEIDRSPSQSVGIDYPRLESVAEHLMSRRDFVESTPATWDDTLFWNAEDSPEARSQMFAIGNSINFRFWQLVDDHMAPAGGTLDGIYFRGAMYMWRSLRRSLTRLPVLDAGFLAELTDADFDALFTDDFGENPLAIARDERIRNLRDLGAELRKSWGGSFYNLVGASCGSLVSFARFSRTIRAFDDPLSKLTMVNAIMHSGSGVYTFADRPIPAIDYHLLRQALRQGLITPCPDLTEKLRGERLLEADEAYELRRTALSALLDVAELTGIDGEILDNRYWLNRTNCTDIDPVCTDPRKAERCPFVAVCAQETGFSLPLELTRYY